MKKPRSRKKGKIIKVLSVLFLLILLVTASLIYYVYTKINSPYKGYPGEEKCILVKKGSSVNDIISLLVSEGIIEDGRSMRLVLRLRGKAHMFQAGEYLFNQPVSALEVHEKLINGDVFYHRFTVIEGKDIYDISELAEETGLFSRDEFLEALTDSALVKDLDPDAVSLEGYLYPDTYYLSRTMTLEETLAIMIGNFKKKYMADLAPVLDSSRLSLRKAVIIASLIEKETSLDSEMPIISSVIHNRLSIGMGLQIDPTIIYALKQEGTYDGNLKRIHKTIDSPFNTYKYRGLPPAPIGNPGIKSLIAACKPAETKYLYYVSKNDGSHVFSTNVEDHNRAVYEWQKKYWNRKWREEREAIQNEADK